MVVTDAGARDRYDEKGRRAGISGPMIVYQSSWGCKRFRVSPPLFPSFTFRRARRSWSLSEAHALTARAARAIPWNNAPSALARKNECAGRDATFADTNDRAILQTRVGPGVTWPLRSKRLAFHLFTAMDEVRLAKYSRYFCNVIFDIFQARNRTRCNAYFIRVSRTTSTFANLFNFYIHAYIMRNKHERLAYI